MSRCWCTPHDLAKPGPERRGCGDTGSGETRTRRHLVGRDADAETPGPEIDGDAETAANPAGQMRGECRDAAATGLADPPGVPGRSA